jgi:hypothetical protein
MSARFSASLAASAAYPAGATLERVQRLTVAQHVAMSHAIDHGRLVPVDASDDFARQRAWRQPIGLGQLHLGEDGRRGCAHVALIECMQLKQAVGAFDDLHPRGDPRAFQRDVGQRIDGDAGRDLDNQGSLPVEWAGSPARRSARNRQAAAEDIDERQGAQLHRGARRIARPTKLTTTLVPEEVRARCPCDP